jgi:hypothetical protein
MPFKVTVLSYSMGAGTTANANATSWILEGGDGAGGAWTKLDIQEGKTLTKEATYFTAPGVTSYTTYRISILKNGGHGATEVFNVDFKFRM